MPDFDPFASDVPTIAFYCGERVEVVDSWTDKTGARLSTIRYADGSKKTVFTSQIFPQVNQ